MRIQATAINRAEVLMRKGLYPGMKGFPMLGLEAAGYINND